jgi:hypothetical protein
MSTGGGGGAPGGKGPPRPSQKFVTPRNPPQIPNIPPGYVLTKLPLPIGGDMYGLEESVDLSFRQGKRCVQVCVGLYQVILHLGEFIQLSIESTCRLNDDEVKHYGRLCDLLGQEVVATRREGRGSLVMTFDKGDVLEVTNDNPGQESYQISAPGVEIIV